MRILIVIGTRPEAIKMAPIVQAVRRRLASRPDTNLRLEVCTTAQHREMVDEALALFDITPDHDLDVMEPGQTPTRVGAAVLQRIEPVLRAAAPDWVLVQGDTTTAAMAALAAFYGRFKVAHVEAGLRTHDKWRPFPEEVNRRLVGAIADLHFAPTASAAANLLREGVEQQRIEITGNTVIDAVRWMAKQPTPAVAQELLAPFTDEQAHGAPPPRLVLVTAHRRENFGAPMGEICAAIGDLAERYRQDVRFLFPVHPNPEVRSQVDASLREVANVTLCEPLDYASLVHVMSRAAVVLTDSGGIQEEGPALGRPVLVLRDVTERPEAIAARTAKLVGPHREAIVRETMRLLDDPTEHARMAHAVSPYGDGLAAERIVAILLGEPHTPFAAAVPP